MIANEELTCASNDLELEECYQEIYKRTRLVPLDVVDINHWCVGEY